MSHFTVLVSAKNDEELEKILLPFHEYECTGIEEYTEFVPEDMDKLKKDHKEYGGDNPLDDEWIEGWCGATKNDDGVYGRITNPNAQWDWWVIGGRWTGFFILKDGTKGRSGLPGLMTPANTDNNRADVACVSDIDWQSMKEDKDGALTYAFIDQSGKWNQRAEMGWWGVSDPTKGTDNYDSLWWDFIKSLKSNQKLYMVDCHI